jgi:hypothetical protein
MNGEERKAKSVPRAPRWRRWNGSGETIESGTSRVGALRAEPSAKGLGLFYRGRYGGFIVLFREAQLSTQHHVLLADALVLRIGRFGGPEIEGGRDIDVSGVGVEIAHIAAPCAANIKREGTGIHEALLYIRYQSVLYSSSVNTSVQIRWFNRYVFHWFLWPYQK